MYKGISITPKCLADVSEVTKIDGELVFSGIEMILKMKNEPELK